MADNWNIRPPSKMDLSGLDNEPDAIVTWFLGNFSLPEGIVPRDPKTGRFRWNRSLGPFAAERVIQRMIRDDKVRLFADDVREAVTRLQSRYNTKKWTVAPWRIVYAQDGAPDMYRRDELRAGECDGRSAIIETVLYPVRDMGWTVHATFVPGCRNTEPGQELEGLEAFEGFGVNRRRFKSVRDVIIALHMKETRWEGNSKLDQAKSRAAIEWIKFVREDDELFVDSKIVIHNSPPAWLPLGKLGPAADGAAITGILITTPTLGQAAIIMLAYGGSRIFLRLVRNVNYLQDAYFERVQRRIRRGDWKPLKD